jgi:hypothetical protein
MSVPVESDSRRNGADPVAVDALADAVAERLASLIDPRAAHALVDTARAADVLGIPESWLAARARNGETPCRRLGKYVRFDLRRAARVDRRDDGIRPRRGSWTSTAGR